MMINTTMELIHKGDLEQLRNILEFVPSAIAVFSHSVDGNVQMLYSNAAAKQLVKFETEEHIYLDELLSIIHPDDRVRMKEMIVQHTLQNEGMDETYRVLKATGGTSWIHHISRADVQPDGSCIFYAVLTDVTAERSFEEIKKEEVFRQYSAYLEKNIDVQDLATAQLMLALQSSMLRSIASMYVVMYLCDLEKNTFVEIYAMDHVKQLFGAERTCSGVLHLVNQHFVAPEFREEAERFNDVTTLPDRLKGKKILSMDYNATIAGWCRQQFIPVTWDENGRAREVICVEQRIQAEKMQVENLRRLAETDGMTQLLYRSSGANYINQYLSEGSHGMFCLFDVDNFKHYNDKYGHAVGDKVLQSISSCMKSTFRNVDVLVRAGGDEFVIYALGLVDPVKGEKKLKEFEKNVAALSFDAFSEPVQISSGVIFSNQYPGESFDDLFKAADERMYKVKYAKKHAVGE